MPRKKEPNPELIDRMRKQFNENQKWAARQGYEPIDFDQFHELLKDPLNNYVSIGKKLNRHRNNISNLACKYFSKIIYYDPAALADPGQNQVPVESEEVHENAVCAEIRKRFQAAGYEAKAIRPSRRGVSLLRVNGEACQLRFVNDVFVPDKSFSVSYSHLKVARSSLEKHPYQLIRREGGDADNFFLVPSKDFLKDMGDKPTKWYNIPFKRESKSYYKPKFNFFKYEIALPKLE
jgi:hypothetical protein